MRVALVGAGAEGAGFAIVLSQQDTVREIRLADVDERRLAHAVEGIGQPQRAELKSHVLDGKDVAEVAAWAASCDIVVNTAGPFLNLPLMRACLRTNSNYLDLSSRPFEVPGLIPREQTIEAQLELDSEFKRIGKVAIISTGIAPGWSDIAARYLCQDFDSVESLTLRWVEWSNASDLITTIGPALVMGINLPIGYAINAGEVQQFDPLASEEPYDWPQPIGTVPVYTMFHTGALKTMHMVRPDAEHVEVKSGLANGKWRSSKEIWLEALRRQLASNVGGDADLAARLGRSFIPPEEYSKAIADGVVTEGAFAVEVRAVGIQEDSAVDRRIGLVVTLAEAQAVDIRLTHMVYATIGTTPSAAIGMLSAGEIRTSGVTPIGSIDNWQGVFQRVLDFGFHTYQFTEERRSLATAPLQASAQ